MNLLLLKDTQSYSKELVFVLYFWGFTLLRPLLQIYSEYSTHILFAYSIILLLVSMQGILHSSLVMKNYILIYGVIFILLIDLLVRPNILTTQYIYEFIIYGLIPILMISRIKDSKILLKIFSIISFFVFILYFSDPLNGYQIFGDYMTFGFMVALPSYFGLYIGRKVFKYKWMLPFELLCLIEILIFSNRSATLSVVIFLILVEFVFEKGSVKKIAKALTVFLFLVVFILFFQDIIFWIVSILNQKGLYSYSMRNIVSSISQFNLEILFSGRLDIWALATDMINKNILFGNGTAAFQALYGKYTHNIYFDIMIQYGFLGLIIMLSLILKSTVNVFRQKGTVKLLGIMLFCLWFPKLFFSNYFLKDIGIWSFIAFGLLYSRKYTLNKKTIKY